MEKSSKKEQVKPSIGQWFSWIIVTIIVIVFSIKILLSELDFNRIQFEFTDLLSIILALFAVWISINFYHKNNETSTKFYNNTYNFTKDISETLGRIEERFGEKLDSLKEENKSLSNRVEKYYSNGGIKEKEKDTEEDIKKEKEIQEKLELEIKDKSKLLNEFSEKYKIAEKDKVTFFNELSEKTEQVNNLQRKLKLFEQPKDKMHSKYNIPSRIVYYISGKFRHNKELLLMFTDQDLFDNSEIINYFNKSSRNFNVSFLNDLEKFDLIDDSRNLTELGLEIFTKIANNLSNLST